MLVLSRKLGEKIYIGENICITVVDIDRGKIRLGIEAPRDVPIYRQELLPLKNNEPKVPKASPVSHLGGRRRPVGGPPVVGAVSRRYRPRIDLSRTETVLSE